MELFAGVSSSLNRVRRICRSLTCTFFSYTFNHSHSLHLPPPSLDSRVLQDKKLSQQQPVKELCDYLLSQQVPSPHLLAIMVDMYEEEASEGDKESLAKAKEVGGA